MRRQELEAKRKKLKKTQGQVADDVGISRAYYSMIEAGKKTPSPPVAKKIASALGFDWTIFFEERVSKSYLA